MNKTINLSDPKVETMSFILNDSDLGSIVIEEESEITEIYFSAPSQVLQWVGYLCKILDNYKEKHFKLEKE